MTVEKNLKFQIVWFDDQEKVFKTTLPAIRQEFKERYHCDLAFMSFVDHGAFLDHFEKHSGKIDFIFLDIDLGRDDLDGIDVYNKIRSTDLDMKIIFISAHLAAPQWEDRIETLKRKDPNLDTIPLDFPLKWEKFDYYNRVSLPIIKQISSKIRLFEYPYTEFLRIEKREKKRLIDKAKLFSRPFVEGFFENNKDVNWIVIGREPGKVLKTGHTGSVLTYNQLVNFSEKEGVMVSGYQRPLRKNALGFETPIAEDDYVDQPQAKSVNILNSKILHIENGYVLLKCLLDEEARNFQIRKFDLEPLDGAVTLEMNNIVQIIIITYEGERKFVFRDGDQGLISKFENRMIADDTDFSEFFEPLPGSPPPPDSKP